MLKHSPTVFPTTLQLVVAIAVFSVLTRPKTVSCTVPLIKFQSRPSRAPLIPSPIAFPRLFQWKFFAKVSTNPKAVFSPLENVLPTNFQSVASMKPFRKVAMLFAILLQVFWILPHGIRSSASLSLLPTMAPSSVKSPDFQESLISFARSLKRLLMAVVWNISLTPPSGDVSVPLPVPPDPELSESSFSLLIWSNPRRVR